MRRTLGKRGLQMEFNHYSVMLAETIDQLNIKPDGIYVDGTLGGAGHAYEVCKRLGAGRFYGFDQDDAAIETAGERLKPFSDKVTIIRDNYCNAKALLHENGVDGVDGIVLDLGVSSYQLDTEERGFSYRYDAPLDMRMDRRQSLTARDIVNNYTESELFHLIRDYGEDQFAKNIAKHIVQARADKPIETTFELSDIIKGAIPAKMRQNGHPAKQTFQAIRIAVNDELDPLESALRSLVERLNPGGRLCVITFHSLEDRIVKNTFRNLADPCTCPKSFPVCVCGKKPTVKLVTRKPITASAEELDGNPRARSASLRIVEKL